MTPRPKPPQWDVVALILSARFAFAMVAYVFIKELPQ